MVVVLFYFEFCIGRYRVNICTCHKEIQTFSASFEKNWNIQPHRAPSLQGSHDQQQRSNCASPVSELCALWFATDPTTPYCLPGLRPLFVLLAWPLWALESVTPDIHHLVYFL